MGRQGEGTCGSSVFPIPLTARPFLRKNLAYLAAAASDSITPTCPVAGTLSIPTPPPQTTPAARSVPLLTVPLGGTPHSGLRVRLVIHSDSIVSYSTRLPTPWTPSSTFSPALKSQASCFLSTTYVSPAHPLWSRPHKTHLLDISSP